MKKNKKIEELLDKWEEGNMSVQDLSDELYILFDYNKVNTFKEAVKPLMKWLCENTHPHTKAIVTGNLAELVEGVENVHTNEFIVD